MSLWPRLLEALEEGPGTAAEIALELGLDSRLVSVNLRALWAAGRLAREPYFTEPAPALPPRRHADGYYRTTRPRRKGRRLWQYSVLDADLVSAPMAGARR